MEHLVSRQMRPRDLAADARLTYIIRRRPSTDNTVFETSQVLDLLLRICDHLTPLDIAIVRAVLSTENLG